MSSLIASTLPVAMQQQQSATVCRILTSLLPALGRLHGSRGPQDTAALARRLWGDHATLNEPRQRFVARYAAVHARRWGSSPAGGSINDAMSASFFDTATIEGIFSDLAAGDAEVTGAGLGTFLAMPADEVNVDAIMEGILQAAGPQTTAAAWRVAVPKMVKRPTTAPVPTTVASEGKVRPPPTRELVFTEVLDSADLMTNFPEAPPYRIRELLDTDGALTGASTLPHRRGVVDPLSVLPSGPTGRATLPLDVFLVPGVAFEVPSGGRLGHGAGFYDRYLTSLFSQCAQRQTPRPLLIAVGFDCQVVEQPEIGGGAAAEASMGVPWSRDADVPVDMVICPRGVYFCGAV